MLARTPRLVQRPPVCGVLANNILSSYNVCLVEDISNSVIKLISFTSVNDIKKQGSGEFGIPVVLLLTNEISINRPQI